MDRPLIFFKHLRNKIYSTRLKVKPLYKLLCSTKLTQKTRNRIRFIRDTLNISTVKSYITQQHINFYLPMRHMSLPLFSLVRAPRRTFWHHSRIIDIKKQHSDHLHRWRRIRPHNSLLMQRQFALKHFTRTWFKLSERFLFCYSSYNPTVGTFSSHKLIFVHDIYEVLFSLT